MRTCSASRSGSAYTATLVRPSSLQARATRTAISPRLAIRTFCTGALPLESNGRTVVRRRPRRSGRSAAPEVGYGQPALGQLGTQDRQGQPDHRRGVALDAADEWRTEAVQRERAGHRERLA